MVPVPLQHGVVQWLGLCGRAKVGVLRIVCANQVETNCNRVVVAVEPLKELFRPLISKFQLGFNVKFMLLAFFFLKESTFYFVLGGVECCVFFFSFLK